MDERLYEQGYLQTALQNFPSQSPSLSSEEGVTGTCCSRRTKKNIQALNATHTHSHTHNLQELSALHIHCGEQQPLNTRLALLPDKDILMTEGFIFIFIWYDGHMNHDSFYKKSQHEIFFSSVT